MGSIPRPHGYPYLHAPSSRNSPSSNNANLLVSSLSQVSGGGGEINADQVEQEIAESSAMIGSRSEALRLRLATLNESYSAAHSREDSGRPHSPSLPLRRTLRPARGLVDSAGFPNFFLSRSPSMHPTIGDQPPLPLIARGSVSNPQDQTR